MKMNKLVLIAITGAAFFASCSDNDTFTPPTKYVPLGKYDSGVLVLNQGGFGHDDASVSYISADFTKSENDIFSTANTDIMLGDTAQDIAFDGDLAYIIVNNSNKIEIVNRYTLKSQGTISTGLSNPRYMVIYNGKGYVTNWGNGSNTADDFVAIVDLNTKVVTGTIPVAEGPERILENNGKLYVAQAGGFGFGNSISVINIATSAVTSIAVGDVPNSMQIKDNYLWVGYGGKPYYAPTETAGGVVKIDLSTGALVQAYGYGDHTKHVSNLFIDGTSVFYTVDAGIYKFGFGDAALPLIPVFTTTAQGVNSVYSFAIKSYHIYVGDAGDYIHAGKVYVYSSGTGPGQSDIGTLEGTYTVGITPTGFYFNF